MSHSIVTEYENISAFSGRTDNLEPHHLLRGNGTRELADEDGVWIPLTRDEHRLSPKGLIYQLHGNVTAEKLSKIAGQLAWERHWISVNCFEIPFESYESLEYRAREEFRKRYKKSWL